MASNCKNCGAPIQDSKCPYCGTLHYDLTVLDMRRDTFVKINTPMGLIEGRMYITNALLKSDYGDSLCGRDMSGRVISIHSKPTVKINLELMCSDDFSITRGLANE